MHVGNRIEIGVHPMMKYERPTLASELDDYLAIKLNCLRLQQALHIG